MNILLAPGEDEDEMKALELIENLEKNCKNWRLLSRFLSGSLRSSVLLICVTIVVLFVSRGSKYYSL